MMDTVTVSIAAFACVFGAAMFGMLLRRILPEHHLTGDTKDTVKLAMGFVATMAALILSLLVAAAKDGYDKQAVGVTQMAAKIVFLDRILANYGPETQSMRSLYKTLVEQVTGRMWPGTEPRESELDPTGLNTEQFFAEIQSLSPKNELQSALKSQAVSISLDLGQMRWLEYEQAGMTASMPLLYFLIFWLAVLFSSFGMFAPRNFTAVASLMLAGLSVAVAIFLIMELRSPFSGLMQIPSAPFVNAAQHLGK
ncbi:MAG: hypothetical protein U0795_06635 [Pirellulales bacterium]